MEFLKREPVLFAAFSLSLITALFEPPSSAYLDYIDFKVLCCLFCLMLIISGFQCIPSSENTPKKRVKIPIRRRVLLPGFFAA